MDEKEEEKVEGKAAEESKEEPEAQGTDDSEDGDTSKAKTEEDKLVKQAEERDERIKNLEREVGILKKGGGSEAGVRKPKKEPETDAESAARVERGEANPFEEDGIV